MCNLLGFTLVVGVIIGIIITILNLKNKKICYKYEGIIIIIISVTLSCLINAMCRRNDRIIFLI